MYNPIQLIFPHPPHNSSFPTTPPNPPSLESAWRFQPGPDDPTKTAAVDFTVRFQVRTKVL